jgi:hypothetical protein
MQTIVTVMLTVAGVLILECIFLPAILTILITKRFRWRDIKVVYELMLTQEE